MKLNATEEWVTRQRIDESVARFNAGCILDAGAFVNEDGTIDIRNEDGVVKAVMQPSFFCMYEQLVSER